MGKFYRSLNETDEQAFVVPHFVGASIGSTDLRRTLRRRCHELMEVLGSTDEIPNDIRELSERLESLLGFDCAEAAEHYTAPKDGWSAAGPPWEREPPKLCDLLERWRAERDEAKPNHPWLRTLRPPPTHLASPLQAILRGHKNWVSSAAFSPDGGRIVSGSFFDMSVRVWDAAIGECLKVIDGSGDVAAIAVGDDQRPLHALTRSAETVVEDARTGGVIAICPAELSHITTHSSGGQWAGAVGNRLHSQVGR